MLIARARRGDRAAFEQLYRRHAAKIYALCRRMSGREAEAEELTQEIFVRVWQKLDTFREGSRFTSWLYRVAVNQVRDAWRKRRRAPSGIPLDDEQWDFEPAEPPAPAGARLDLEQALETLPDGARHVLVLHDVHGYRHEEIARMIGASIGTSKSQLHRARHLLRKRLHR